jgi:two-component system, NtrC family, response regulator PilR
VDVRILSATHRKLDELVKAGKFREDLYYRINVIELHVPALRERLDDVPRWSRCC